MILNHLFEHIPYFWLYSLHKAFRALNVVCEVLLYQLAHDKRLEEFQGHLLGQPALVQLQIRPNHDHRTTRVVNALTKQILSEAALLTLEHVGQALQLVIARTSYCATTSPVVNQSITCLLQHALLIPNYDLWCAQL